MMIKEYVGYFEEEKAQKKAQKTQDLRKQTADKRKAPATKKGPKK